MNPYEIDPITGRLRPAQPALTNSPPAGSPASQLAGGLASGFQSFLQPRNLAGSASPLPDYSGIDIGVARRPANQHLGPGDGVPEPDATSPQGMPVAPPVPAPPSPEPEFQDGPAVGSMRNQQPPPPDVPRPLPGALDMDAGDAPSMGAPPNATPMQQPLPLPPPSPPRAPPGAPQGAAPGPVGALSGPIMAPPNAAGAPNDDIDAFAQMLMPAESSGRPDVVNRGGYAGLFQFGAPRLQTLGVYSPGPNEQMRGWGGRGGGERTPGQWTGTFNIPGFENVRTLQDFLNNADAQRAVFRGHVVDIDQAIDSTPGAEAFNRNGLRGAAHIGGNGGMRGFVESGGGATDVNGQGPASYYRRFAGQDAPNNPGARRGPADTATPLSAPANDAAPAAPSGPQAVPQAGNSLPLGMSPEAWFSLSAGLFGGRNMNEGLSRGLAGMVQQSNVDGARQDGRANRAEARADRQQARADTNAYRQSTLDVARARAAAVQNGLQARGAATPYSHLGTFRAEDGTVVSQRLNRATGAQEWVGQDNQVIPADRVPQRLTRLQDTGDGAAANAVGRQGGTDNVEAADAVLIQARNAAPSITNIRSLRELITREGATGPSVGAQAQRALVGFLGVPIGSVTPQGLSLTDQQINEFVSTRLPELVRELRPVSNIDAEGVRRALITMRTDPNAILTLLDQFEAPLQRQQRLAQEWGAMGRPEQLSILRTPTGVNQWIAQRRAAFDQEGFGVTPSIGANPASPTVGAPPAQNPGSAPWRAGETRQAPGGITIQRIN